MATEANTGEVLDGDVEVDGAYFGGYRKPENYKEDRIDRRRAINQTGKCRVVVVMRERNGRTLPFVFKSEAESIATIGHYVAPTATVYADEARGWDALHDRFLTKRIIPRGLLFGRRGVHQHGRVVVWPAAGSVDTALS